MLVLAGIAIIALGFLLRFNPMLVIAASALVTGLAAGIDPLAILAAFGKAFNDTRYVTAIYIVLPVIGLLERNGLQARARSLVGGLKGLTTGRLLMAYLAFRQITAALGLTSVAGPAQTVRPLIAPMAEAAAGEAHDPEQVKAMAAATDASAEGSRSAEEARQATHAPRPHIPRTAVYDGGGDPRMLSPPGPVPHRGTRAG